VVKLNDFLPMNLTYSFTSNTLPFARLVLGHVNDFDVFSAALKGALSLSDANTERYFTDLNRFINPLRVNLNPTDSEIGAAEQRVNDLLAITAPIANAISAYTPAVVTEMDHLVKTFKEKGADRATDILLECRLSTFFGLSQDETSYSGHLQAAIRDVARLDLPVHKTNRLSRSLSQLKSSADSIDYEYSTADMDTTPLIDPPVEGDTTSS